MTYPLLYVGSTTGPTIRPRKGRPSALSGMTYGHVWWDEPANWRTPRLRRTRLVVDLALLGVVG